MTAHPSPERATDAMVPVPVLRPGTQVLDPGGRAGIVAPSIPSPLLLNGAVHVAVIWAGHVVPALVPAADLTRTTEPTAPGPAGPRRPARYDQCDASCTVDCGHCKGQGPPAHLTALKRADDLSDLGEWPPLRIMPPAQARHVMTEDDVVNAGLATVREVFEDLKPALRAQEDAMPSAILAMDVADEARYRKAAQALADTVADEVRCGAASSALHAAHVRFVEATR